MTYFLALYAKDHETGTEKDLAQIQSKKLVGDLSKSKGELDVAKTQLTTKDQEL